MTSAISTALLLAATTKKSGSSDFYLIIIYVVLIGGFYYFYMRPRSRRMKQQRTEQRKVDVGDRAQTIGGFVGTVVRNESNLVTLRTDGGVELDFVPQAIARRYDPPAAIPESSDDDHDHPTEGNAS
jgi:preprotein translocase YajC subunit